MSQGAASVSALVAQGIAAAFFAPWAALAQPVLITDSKTVGPSDTTIVATAGGPVIPLEQAEIQVVGTTLTINGRHTIKSLSLQRSAANAAGVATHAPGFQFDYSGGAGTDIVFGMCLNVTGNVLVEGADGALVESRIDGNGRGYPASQGPGAAPWSPCCGGGGGASHAGNGANGDGFSAGALNYGSLTRPSDFGSGGANVWFFENGGRGGGAVYLSVGGTLTVDGSVACNGAVGSSGGGGSGGGGSGGSILIEAHELAGGGSISAVGGAGYSIEGGSGGGGRIAIYCNSSSFSGMTSTNGGASARAGGAGTTYMSRAGFPAILRIDNQGVAGASTDINEPLAIEADVEIGPGAKISHGPGRVAGLRLNIMGNMTIEAGGSINTTGRGYTASQGPGAVPGGGCCGGGGGAAHAGNAGNGREFAGSTSTYGSVTQPTQLGSGGQNVWGANVGGYGGGAIRLSVSGALTISGSVRSDGDAGRGGGDSSGGGGSGGSVWVDAGSFNGSGAISVNGGAGVNPIAGGGGGGRIAIYCNASTYVGVTQSVGGGFAGRQGGAGTVYLARAGSPAVLRIDNEGIMGATTDINEPLVLDADMEVGPGARVSHGAGRLTGLLLELSGSVRVEVGGSIDTTGRGYSGSQGPGAPPVVGCCGGGGGAAHAGSAGNGREFAGSTATYGSVTQPVQLGSGGQNVWWSNVGGNGGGAAHLIIGGTLTVDGSVRSDGGMGVGGGDTSGGGGSGGSIWIEALALNGSGKISANGGAGVNGIAGGGGGGRIAIYSNTSNYFGELASIGAGFIGRQGGAGTVYVASAGVLPILRIDNQGIEGATTDINEPLVFDGDVEIGPGARVSHGLGRTSGLSMEITGDMTIESGGSINTTSRGYPASQGPGTRSGSGDGGGAGAAHGGVGGDGQSFSGSGAVYGSAAHPAEIGSGGQSMWWGAAGGFGGGAVGLSVAGALMIDGELQCDGGPGIAGTWGGGGGGSGGSILIQAGTLAGSGTVHARGGAGYSNIGGGGGGGRIAIYTCNLLLPLEKIQSFGGGGYRSGESGTIHFGSEGMTISEQTESVAICAAGTAHLSVSAGGSGPFTYQWQWKEVGAAWKDVVEGLNLDSQGLASFAATDPSLAVLSVDPVDTPAASAGTIESMRCIAAGVCGFVISDVIAFGICDSDFNCDGQVEDSDFVVFAQAYNVLVCDDPAMPVGCPADLNGDGVVDDADFVVFVGAYNELLCS